MTRRDLTWYKTLVEARTDGEGKPKKGFGANVAMLRAEIAKIEKALDAQPQPDA
jgi:hypothetical protein